MTQVMKECDRLKASSVAIPSIGAGNLGFPDDVVARILFDAVSTYLDQNRSTSVKKVTFMIFDGNTHAAFQTAFNKLSPTKRGPVPSPVPSRVQAPANVASCIEVKRGSLTDHQVYTYAVFVYKHSGKVPYIVVYVHIRIYTCVYMCVKKVIILCSYIMTIIHSMFILLGGCVRKHYSIWPCPGSWSCIEQSTEGWRTETTRRVYCSCTTKW